ncbi:hypothetical protein HMI54_003670, partial [Coelomomyces lativittatus]
MEKEKGQLKVGRNKEALNDLKLALARDPKHETALDLHILVMQRLDNALDVMEEVKSDPIDSSPLLRQPPSHL